MQQTIPEAFFEAVSKNPSKPALLHKKEGVYFPIRYQELADSVNSLAAQLHKLNIGKGDRVAILSENRPEWLVSDLAIMSVGAVVAPLHTTLSPKAIFNCLNHCQAKILIVSNASLLHSVLLEKEGLLHLKKIICMEKLSDIEKESLNGRILAWKTIMERSDGKFEKIFLDADDFCSLIYTSGTTGDPKAVCLTHKNFLSNVEAINSVIPVKESDIFLSFLPLSHVLERTAGQFVPILQGATIAYAENSRQLPYNLREVKPTVLISVPRVFEKFQDAIWDKVNAGPAYKKKIFTWSLKQKKNTAGHKVAKLLAFNKIKKMMGGRLRLAISGGASLSEDLARFFWRIGVSVLEGYGLTETSPVLCVNREKDFKFGTVGKPVPGVKIKIKSDKEILAKGHNVFSRYFNYREEDTNCFDREGWFCTGDLGFIDKQGFLTVIGRKKEMIVLSGGKNVWPEPIESVLNEDRFISQSVVIGNNHKFISALIVPDWQEVKLYLKEKNLPMKGNEELAKSPEIIALFQERLDQKINSNLSEFEKVKKFRLIPQEFSQENDELTPTLKIRRQIVAKHYAKEIESLYN